MLERRRAPCARAGSRPFEADPRRYFRSCGEHHRHRGTHRVRAFVAAARPVDHRGELCRRCGTMVLGAVARRRIPTANSSTPGASLCARGDASAPIRNAPYDSDVTSSRSRRSAARRTSRRRCSSPAPKTLQELLALREAEGRRDHLLHPPASAPSTDFTTERFRFSACFDGVDVLFRGTARPITGS